MRRKLAALLPLCLFAIGCENSQHAQRLERREAIREAHLRNLRGAATGFEDTRWSMSPDEVRARYPEAVIVDGGGLELQSEHWEMPATIRFSFDQEKLAAVTLYLGPQGDLREAHRGVASMLQTKFGEPDETRDSAEEAARQRAVLSALAGLAFVAETIQAVQERRPPDASSLEQMNERALMAAEDAYWDTREYTLHSRWNTSATEVHLLGRRAGDRQGLSLSYVSTVLRAGSI
ncbi:hypothetical protein D7Y11_23305 [Corallococcus sp. AB018]|uniref:hypothetical protein n=1 Tax=Corallococcus sp. AB018 TaxID=2316715 RepID=UPI000F873554|nr:hypothetical protein [Corallococcus sp. AB018]RUO90772.1 hypothetical protein D7Y11_23305 [Corallococcus sp. AB018]